METKLLLPKPLYVPLNYLKKLSDKNLGWYDRNIDVDLFRKVYPEVKGLFCEEITFPTFSDIDGLTTSTHYVTLCFKHQTDDGYFDLLSQNLSLEQYNSVIELNELLDKVDFKDL